VSVVEILSVSVSTNLTTIKYTADYFSMLESTGYVYFLRLVEKILLEIISMLKG
jgi:hypothetical protein